MAPLTYYVVLSIILHYIHSIPSQDPTTNPTNYVNYDQFTNTTTSQSTQQPSSYPTQQPVTILKSNILQQTTTKKPTPNPIDSEGNVPTPSTTTSPDTTTISEERDFWDDPFGYDLKIILLGVCAALLLVCILLFGCYLVRKRHMHKQMNKIVAISSKSLLSDTVNGTQSSININNQNVEMPMQYDGDDNDDGIITIHGRERSVEGSVVRSRQERSEQFPDVLRYSVFNMTENGDMHDSIDDITFDNVNSSIVGGHIKMRHSDDTVDTFEEGQDYQIAKEIDQLDEMDERGTMKEADDIIIGADDSDDDDNNAFTPHGGDDDGKVDDRFEVNNERENLMTIGSGISDDEIDEIVNDTDGYIK